MALRMSLFVYLLLTLCAMPTSAADPVTQWRAAGTDTDFFRATVDLGEIHSSGPGKGGISAIDAPRKARLFCTMDDMRTVEAVGRIDRTGPQRLLRSPWKRPFFDLLGERRHLDWIEHDRLRPVYAEPRVHFAVNCASVGCPALRPEPYVAARFDEQLNDQL